MTYQKLIIPTAFIYGADAKLAIEQGIALPLAGGFAAFTMVRLILRNGADACFMSVAQLQDYDDAEVTQQLEGFAAVRADICGMSVAKPHIMGILNLTPDSFSDGGTHDDLAQLERQVDDYIELGVSILDIGGESTRPNAGYVSCEQEIARIKPVLDMLKSKNICISIDTRKAKVMEFALEHGADIINDVSALEFRADQQTYGEDSGDSEQVVLMSDCPVILMHSQGTPEIMQDNPCYENILFEIYDYLKRRIEDLVKQGIDKDRIIIDPGIGFGKSVEHNLTILNHLSLFHSLGVLVLVGASRKSFIGHVSGQSDAMKRLGGSLAAAHIAMNAGVQLHRMHDVDDSVQLLNTMSAIHQII